jgi:hypothetical protein
MLNQTYADSGIAHVSQIIRDLVLESGALCNADKPWPLCIYTSAAFGAKLGLNFAFFRSGLASSPSL